MLRGKKEHVTDSDFWRETSFPSLTDDFWGCCSVKLFSSLLQQQQQKKPFQSEGRLRVRVMFMKNLQLLFYLSHMDNSSSSRQRERHKNNIKPITESPLAWAPAIVTIHLPSHSLVRKPYLSHKSLLLRSLYVVRAWVKWLLFNVI